MSQELADRLHSAAIHLLRRVATMDAGSGLSPARLSALSVIVYGGPLTMSALARAERVSPATISSTVSGLESAGLVARRRDGTDARSVTVEATDDGRPAPLCTDDVEDFDALRHGGRRQACARYAP